MNVCKTFILKEAIDALREGKLSKCDKAFIKYHGLFEKSFSDKRIASHFLESLHISSSLEARWIAFSEGYCAIARKEGIVLDTKTVLQIERLLTQAAGYMKRSDAALDRGTDSIEIKIYELMALTLSQKRELAGVKEDVEVLDFMR